MQIKSCGSNPADQIMNPAAAAGVCAAGNAVYGDGLAQVLHLLPFSRTSRGEYSTFGQEMQGEIGDQGLGVRGQGLGIRGQGSGVRD